MKDTFCLFIGSKNKCRWESHTPSNFAKSLGHQGSAEPYLNFLLKIMSSHDKISVGLRTFKNSKTLLFLGVWWSILILSWNWDKYLVLMAKPWLQKDLKNNLLWVEVSVWLGLEVICKQISFNRQLFNTVVQPRCHNSKVRRFSQGLPCKTPLRTHSKQAMLLPSTQSSPKTREPFLFPNALFDKWKQDTDF
jgi:hypothetical protein